ncbi:hypothetical protein ACFYO0_45130 [Streptomyces sp. NPDC006365]|uniref:hypothetical protein n=1 Tax=Streptomyces sp. NPDC006365 TaxID=3364744 RepID=UPI0036ADC75A
MRDHQHRSAAHLPSRWCGYRALDGDLLTHALKDPLGDSEFVSLGPYLGQLLGQPFFEHVHCRSPRGDPFQHPGVRHGTGS